MEVIYHRLVVWDLRVALNYYELEGGTKLADRFFAEVEEGVAKIIAQPTAHYFSDGGYRFTVNGPKNKSLPGKPDIVLPKHRTVIFVHGCLWHGHENRRTSLSPAGGYEMG